MPCRWRTGWPLAIPPMMRLGMQEGSIAGRIGSRGLRGVSHMILGEVGHDVALNAPMPVAVAT